MRLTVLLSTLLSVLFLAASTGAQQAPVATPDYATWNSVATRAETAIDEGVDSNEVFESLRLRIAGFRQSFDAARNANRERIATLRSQIEALGPAPAEGETEADDIAARRAELNERLAELQAPIQAAQEAFTRADGLIGEIDRIIRERQTRRLLELGPSPLNPVLWPQALDEGMNALYEIWAERRVFNDPQLLEQARANLPLVILLLALAVVLILRGRRWAAWLGDRLRTLGGTGTGVWSFVVSLFRIILPLAGLYALTEAIFATGLVGMRGTAILNALPLWGAVLLGFRWLAERLFSRDPEEAVLPLAQDLKSEARFYMTMIALLLVVRGFVDLLFDFSDMSPGSEAVIAFPVVVLIGLMLFRIGQILRRVRSRDPEDETSTGTASQGLARLVRAAGMAAQAIAVVAPVMSAIGYAAVGNAMLYPSVLSLGLLGFVMTLQRFLGDVYGWLTGRGDAARDSLFAVMLSFLLLLLAAPLLALIWGARVADLTELWSSFMRGFAIGETRISPTNFITLAIIFAAGYILTRLLQNALKTSVLPKTKIDVGGQNALVSGVGYIGIFLAALIAITAAGINLSSLAIVAGALSVGIGFGLQNIVSNFVSGIILLIERPISEGDWIEVGGMSGYVKDISVRSTRIETFDRSDVIVPNSDFVSGTVTNYTRGNTVGRVIVPVGVAYGTDTRKVESILREIAEAHPMVLMNPKPGVVFMNFGASSLDFEIRAILRDVNFMLSVKSEMNHQIAQRFEEEGIEIPFPQQDVWLRNPEKIAAPPDLKPEEAGFDDSEGDGADEGGA